MKTIILGAGDVGYNVASKLILENRDIIIIEKKLELAKFTSNHLDCIVIQGDGTNLDTLSEAGIKDADIFISVTDSDEVNMISCMLLDNNETTVKIARVRNINYTRTMLLKKPMGIDYVINPEIEASKSIINTVEHGAISDIYLFEHTDIQMRNIFIDRTFPFINKSVKFIRKAAPGDYIIAGVQRKGDVILPHGDIIIKEQDSLYIIGKKLSINKFLSKTGSKVRKLKNIVVAGMGKIGRYVASYLDEEGRNVKVVDADYNKCKEIAEDNSGLLVIHGDISDENVFEEERLANNDLIITATDNEELNILSAVYAKSVGVKRSIAVASKANYLQIAPNLGIDSTVSPKMSAVNTILKYIRKGKVKNVFPIFDGRAEAIEFTISSSNKFKDICLKDLEMPKDSLIVAVIRGKKSFIPSGDFKIETSDNIITFSKKVSTERLEEMFSS